MKPLAEMDAGSIVWVIILSLTAIFIFFSNLSIFIAVYKSRKLQNRGNIFILCLASSDFLVSVFNVPFTAVSVAYPSIRQNGSTLCDVSGFFEMTILIASVFSVTAINVHRYIYIVFWTKYREILRKKRIIVSILCLWLSAIILSAPPLVSLSKIAYKSGKSHCFVDWKVTPVYTFSLILICFLMPIIVMGFCYYSIYKFRQRSRKILQQRLTKQFVASDSREVALDKHESTSDSTENSFSSGKEQDKTVQTIANFLNEPIDMAGEHCRVEMQDLQRENSKVMEDERMLSELGNSDVEGKQKDKGCIAGNKSETKVTTHVKFEEMSANKPIDLPLQKKQRRSRTLSLLPGEQKLDDASINMPKKNELKKKTMGQKYKGFSVINDEHRGSRKIEILVEE